MKKVEAPELRTLVEAGVVRSVTLVADGRSWYVILDLGATERVLGSQRRHRRTFKDLNKLVALLRDLGIGTFRIDATHYAGQQTA